MRLFVFMLFDFISVSHHTRICIIKRLQTLTYFKTLNCISLKHHMVDSWSINIQKWKKISILVYETTYFFYSAPDHHPSDSSSSIIYFKGLIKPLGIIFTVLFQTQILFLQTRQSDFQLAVCFPCSLHPPGKWYRYTLEYNEITVPLFTNIV